MPHPSPSAAGIRLGQFGVLAGLFATAICAFADETPKPAPASRKEKVSQFLNDLLPTAWQKQPQVRFNVYTEMMPEGRKRRVPTPAQPLHYFASPARFAQMGWSVAAGEKPPPVAQLEAAMREALAAGGYLAVADDHQRPDILLVFSFGSSGTDPIAMMKEEEMAENDPNPTSADYLVNALMHDPALYRDVIERARLVAGDKFALEMKAAIDEEFSNRRFNQTFDRLPPGIPPPYLPVSPDGGSPLQLFMDGGKGRTHWHLVELAFHTCYFVTATAYDFAGVEKKQKIPLWQTRMTVEAQGVAMAEILKPLIVNTGAYIGRETPETVIVAKRISRESRVEIGTPTVVEEAKPGSTPANGPPGR